MAEYDKQTLKHLQKCERLILEDFVKICNENDIEYFGMGGTGIGALRHGGFIPWDDDIDLGLSAKDLDKLITIVNDQYSDKYEMMNTDANIEYPLSTTRMMLRGTQFCEEALADLPLDLGIFLDLYGLENVSDDDREYKRQARSAWFWSHIRLLKSIPRPTIIYHGVKGAIVKCASYIAGAILQVVGPSKEYAYKKELEARKRYCNQKTKRVAFLNDTSPYSSLYVLDEIFPLQTLNFDGIPLKFDRSLDKQLRDLYGDYMQLPPENQRKNHYPARLDFGPYKDF